MRNTPRYYSEEQVLRLIHDGAAKCRRNINLADSEDQIDCAISLCNCLSNSIVAILNNEDHQILGRKFNIHRKWCQRAFGALQAVVTELDARITIRKNEIEGQTTETATKIGFNS